MISFIVDCLEQIILSNEDNENNNSINSYVLAIAMYINFNYENIVCQPHMLDFLTSELSFKHMNEISDRYPLYTRRQIETIYIAFNIFIYLYLFTNEIN